MDILPVNCNRCGAAVAVGPDTRHVTCAHCRTPLVVVRTASSTFTDIAARQKELERIDREWEEEKQRDHTYTDKSGGRHTHDEMLEPMIGLAVLGGLTFLVLVGVAVRRQEWGALVALLGLVGLLVGMAVYTIVKSRRYWRAEARYRERRAAAEREPRPDGPG